MLPELSQYILVLVLIRKSRLFQKYFSAAKIEEALCILVCTSSFELPNRAMLLPRYVNEVTCSIGSFSMVKLLLGFMGSVLAVMYFDFWQFNFN